jgi:hypothetical protein
MKDFLLSVSCNEGANKQVSTKMVSPDLRLRKYSEGKSCSTTITSGRNTECFTQNFL